jgi:hypothetical protein
MQTARNPLGPVRRIKIGDIMRIHFPWMGEVSGEPDEGSGDSQTDSFPPKVRYRTDRPRERK